MKYIPAIGVLIILISSCKKDTTSITAAQQQDPMIIDEYMAPEVKALVVPNEAPLPERPYLLVEYINVHRAYENIPQSNSYSYTYYRTIESYEAPESYTPPYTIVVDYDTYQQKPGVDISKILDCFQTIPDIGATCSIELLTDLPMDGNPNMFFDWNNGFPGHSFIQLKKSNAGKTAVINFGMYPVQSWKLIYTSDQIQGKVVNDTQHEYNASMKMNLTPSQLAAVISAIRINCKVPRYDIDDFNCTDFAVRIFNTVRPQDPLIVPKYEIPGGITSKPASCPQGLYKEMLRRWRYAPMSGVQFTFPQSKTYAESSKYPCK